MNQKEIAEAIARDGNCRSANIGCVRDDCPFNRKTTRSCDISGNQQEGAKEYLKKLRGKTMKLTDKQIKVLNYITDHDCGATTDGQSCNNDDCLIRRDTGCGKPTWPEAYEKAQRILKEYNNDTAPIEVNTKSLSSSVTQKEFDEICKNKKFKEEN